MQSRVAAAATTALGTRELTDRDHVRSSEIGLLRHSLEILAVDSASANVVACLKGNGRKRPILIMGHTDVVTVDTTKWTHPPFAATHDGGYVYGHGAVDKDDVTAGLMTIQFKRLNVPRDVAA